MPNDKLREQIAAEAARLIQAGEESGYYPAKMRAARGLRSTWIKQEDLPPNSEVRDQMHHRNSVQPSGSEHDRFVRYHTLLVPLESIKLNPKEHPEGDALYHSLQVYELARDAIPYDEEFQLAALLHEVGRAVDPANVLAATLESLGDDITERTRWLIEHLPEAAQQRESGIGVRSQRRLQASEDYEQLVLLERLDRQGRKRGVATGDVEQVLAEIRQLAADCGE